MIQLMEMIHEFLEKVGYVLDIYYFNCKFCKISMQINYLYWKFGIQTEMHYKCNIHTEFQRLNPKRECKIFL